MNSHSLFEVKIKDKIINEFNEDLYRNFNMSLSDADDLYGWGYGYIYKILNRVFKNYGPVGLRRETEYIIQYLDFLLLKLKNILNCNKNELPYSNRNLDTEFYKLYFSLMIYLRYYRHHGRRKSENPDQLKLIFWKLTK